jgi:hypothetical protein
VDNIPDNLLDIGQDNIEYTMETLVELDTGRGILDNIPHNIADNIPDNILGIGQELQFKMMEALTL